MTSESSITLFLFSDYFLKFDSKCKFFMLQMWPHFSAYRNPLTLKTWSLSDTSFYIKSHLVQTAKLFTQIPKMNLLHSSDACIKSQFPSANWIFWNSKRHKLLEQFEVLRMLEKPTQISRIVLLNAQKMWKKNIPYVLKLVGAAECLIFSRAALSFDLLRHIVAPWKCFPSRHVRLNL